MAMGWDEAGDECMKRQDDGVEDGGGGRSEK